MAPGGLFPVYQQPTITEDTDDTPAATTSTEDVCDEAEAAAQAPSTQIAHDQSAADESASDEPTPLNKKEAGKPLKKRAASPAKSAATTKKAKADGKQKNQAVAKKSPARKPKDPQTVGKKATATAVEAGLAGPKAKKVANPGLPKKYEKAGPADKFLFDNHEKGMSFEEITPHWLELAGRSTSDVLSNSMLSNRYSRMKMNFSMIKEEDHVLLFEAKKRIDAELEAERWARVAADMVSNGGGSYTPDNLQRCHKKLMEKGGDIPKSVAPRDRDESDDDGDD